MVDEIPVRVWLLVAIAASAVGPALYVRRHIVHAPSRRDITQPPEDLSWRTSKEYGQSLAMLAGLGALAVFIFTPWAEQVASSPRFWPGLILGLGVTAAATVVRGFRGGEIRPFMQGAAEPYRRTEQPRRYWASMAWNLAFGCLLIWTSLGAEVDVVPDGPARRCVVPSDYDHLERELEACARYIRQRPDDGVGYMDRGLIWLDAGVFDAAAADFDEAYKLDPKNHGALANRGVAAAWQKDKAGAEKAFAAVRSVDPSNPAMLRGETILRQQAGDVRGAVDRLSRSLAREPDDLWALRTRSELYWELKEYEKSARDDARWVELKAKAATQPVQPPSAQRGSP